MSVVLDVAVGLMTIFLVFSILVSGINEWVAQVFGRRGEFLRIGLQRLINDEAIYRRVLHHPLIDSLYRQRAARGKPPSYIDPANFAMALANVLLARGAASKGEPAAAPPLSVEALHESLASAALANSPVVAALGPIVDRAGDNIETALTGIQEWFNASMDRVSGWYKSRTRNVLFGIGFAVAALCNVDTIQIYSTLNQSSALRASLAAIATSAVATGKIGDVNIAELQTRAPTASEWASLQPMFEALRADGGSRLPIGWDCLGTVVRAGAAGPVGQATEAEGTGVKASAGRGGDAMKSAADAVVPSAEATTPTNAWKACAAATSRVMTQGSISDGILKIVGWLLSALAGTLGANYWFALLTNAVKIRGSGEKPAAAQV
jgi:hypothetical protein